MHDESRADALAVRVEREKLHPARIDADERLVGGRRQTGNRPVVTLGLAWHGNAALDRRVRESPEPLAACGRRSSFSNRATYLNRCSRDSKRSSASRQVGLALYPIALLLRIQELAQTGGAAASRRAHVRCHVRSVCSSLHRPAPDRVLDPEVAPHKFDATSPNPETPATETGPLADRLHTSHRKAGSVVRTDLPGGSRDVRRAGSRGSGPP